MIQPNMESCCTCATVLAGDGAPRYAQDSDNEKPLPEDRRVACCARVICGQCIFNNRRFASYCPYCQISTSPSPLPQGLKAPPSYTSVRPTNIRAAEAAAAPPPYSSTAANTNRLWHGQADDEKPAEDTLHFLNHEHDTIASLSLRYNVPAEALRRSNNITSDHLLQGRKTVVIPGEFYKGGVSLSPRPIEGEDEELRKGKIRRFMTSCKVSDYDVALLYLEQAGYDLDAATEAFIGDEVWESEHPNQLPKSGKKAKGKTGRGPFWRGL